MQFLLPLIPWPETRDPFIDFCFHFVALMSAAVRASLSESECNERGSNGKRRGSRICLTVG